MAEQLEVKELDQVVVRFSGDSGDGILRSVPPLVTAFPHSQTIPQTSVPRKDRSRAFLVSRYTSVRARCTPLATSATCSWR